MAVIEEIEADSDDLVEACDIRVRCADAETRMTLSCASLSYAKSQELDKYHVHAPLTTARKVRRGEGRRRTWPILTSHRGRL